MWVDDSRVEEYLAAGYSLAAKAVSKPAVKATTAKTSKSAKRVK